jgi:transposase
MTSRRYKVGRNREQVDLLPPSLEEYVSPTNEVRAIEAYVESLDLRVLGFSCAGNLGNEGQPAYPPSMLLKLYLYGYMNRIRSSRRLERETRINIELMWLLEDFKPSHATIANFRKDNLKGIKAVNKDFVQLCREMNLYGGEEVGIDGTFMRGNASKASIHLQEVLEKEAEKIEQSIEKYLAELEKTDLSEKDLPKTEDAQLPEKLKRLRERQSRCETRRKQLETSGEKQLSETDKDARLLNKRGQTIAGYNVQIAVDSKHKLLVCNDVVQDNNDTQQLEPMALKAKEILEVDGLVVDADKGYENHQQIKACEEANITAYVPLADKAAQTRAQGRFIHDEYTYDAQTDSYQCPAGQTLSRQGNQNKNGKIQHKYVSKASSCKECKLKQQCLPEKTRYKQLYRWEHQEVMERHRSRMEKDGREHMKNRSGLAEHPFGIMKIQMGWLHFLMRGLEKVRAEMNLQMFSYNFQRVLKLVGIDAFKNHLNAQNMT